MAGIQGFRGYEADPQDVWARQVEYVFDLAVVQRRRQQIAMAGHSGALAINAEQQSSTYGAVEPKDGQLDLHHFSARIQER